MKKKIHHDVYVGILMAVVSLLGYLRTLIMPKGSDLFPTGLFGLFALFSIIIIVKGIKESKIMTKENRSDVISFEGLKLPVTALIIITIYSISLKYIGFFVSTVIYIPAFMYFYRYRKIPIILVSIIGMLAFIYLVFVKQLNVQFPKGILF